MNHLIPTDTIITNEQLEMLPKIIERKTKELSALNYGQVEKSLWLMEELEHHKELLNFNLRHKESLTPA